MIATREKLIQDIEWRKRVILCGDNLSRERSEEIMPGMTADLAQIVNDIEYTRLARRALLKRYVFGALATCTLLLLVGLAQSLLTHPLPGIHK